MARLEPATFEGTVDVTTGESFRLHRYRLDVLIQHDRRSCFLYNMPDSKILSHPQQQTLKLRHRLLRSTCVDHFRGLCARSFGKEPAIQLHLLISRCFSEIHSVIDPARPEEC